MPFPLTQAIYDRLVSDNTLTALLGTYQGAPNVFTAAKIPEDVTGPYVVTNGNDADTPNDCKNSLGRDVRRFVLAVTEGTGSAGPVEAIAERVYELLHRETLPVVGHAPYVADVLGPVVVPSDPDFYVRRIELRQLSFST